MLLETGKLYYGQRKMDRDSIKDQEIFYFPETTELEYSGEKPKDGYLTIYEDGSQYIEVTNGTYCAYGEQASDIKIKDGQCQDPTPGILDGSGTEKDPYKIESIEDLVQFGKNVDNGNTYENKYITLERSLDFKNEKSYVNHLRTDYGDINENGVSESLLTELTTEKGFNPIGFQTGDKLKRKSFHGNLDGKNYWLSNLYIHRLNEMGIALISINYGTIQNWNMTCDITENHATSSGSLISWNLGDLTNVHVKGTLVGDQIGGITGQNGSASWTDTIHIQNVMFEGKIVSQKFAGGIAASIGPTILSNAVVFADIELVAKDSTPKANGVGGITFGGRGTVRNSFFSGTIKGYDQTGGALGVIGGNGGDILVDYTTRPPLLVENVYTIGQVEGDDMVGGIVGHNGDSYGNDKNKYVFVRNSYSLMDVSGSGAVGGVIGSNVMNAENLYAGGTVSGGTNPGNVVGRRENSDATITNVYSNEGQQVLGSNPLTLGIVVLLPTLSPSSWWKNTLGFDNNWKIEDGYYPLLYKVDESGNPTTELLPGQKKIPIQ